MTSIPVELPLNGYEVHIGRGLLHRAAEELNLRRRVLIVTDEGVPAGYAETLAAQCAVAHIETVPQGEGSKSYPTLERLHRRMLELGFSRSDCVAAVGGGVVGDLAGFAAATYMRGIDFYNLPTTVLSQVDSSVGGKTAINLAGIKNIVGAFHQPRRVIIDPDTLATLPARQVASGLAEALKMSLTCSEALFRLFERYDPLEQLEEIITQSVRIKATVVTADEREQGLRKILNFGHTIGHGIESFEELHGLYHGECVALGMLPMCSNSLRTRLLPIYEKLGLPTACALDPDQVYAAMVHDKKANGERVTVTLVEEPGSYELRELPLSELRARLSLIAK